MSMRIKKIFLLQLVLVAIEVLLVSSQITREGCQDKCGNVSIPYPFGTREGCYHDADFRMTCNSTSYNPPKPFLRVSDIEVTNISIDGKLYITQVIAMACFNKSGAPLDLNYYDPDLSYLSLKSFYISDTDNKFIGVGCDTHAEIMAFQGDSYEYTGGCITRCLQKEYVANYSCSGIGCCQTPIAKGMSYFEIRVGSYKNQTEVWSFSPCSYAFVVQESEFNFTSNMLMELMNVSQFPVVLDWSIGEETCSNVKNKACKGNSTCLDVENGLGYRCKCNDGYRGNPYLNGCHDIDECENDEEIFKKCQQNSHCINTEGSYTCSCNKGYHGNGNADGEGCVADQKFVVQITVGLGVGFISLLVGSSWLYLGYRRWKLVKLKEKFFKQNGGLMLQKQISEQGTTNQTPKIFTEDQLKKATNNFSEARIVGKGGFGTVYKGIIADERAKEAVVAIKKSKLVDRSQIQQFINEVLVLSQINHRNVVKLLGCCFETEVPLLVYEFVTNGTLFDYIHNKSKASNFAWEFRLRIAAETAGVLSYLHSAASVPIIHRDVKSTNILLDDELTAKVSDFGASRLVPPDQTQLTTMVQGTLGYLDPEYLQTSQLTDKSDVYSFGVVLVELLTGKKAISFDKPEEERNLAMYFLSALKDDRLVQVIDGYVVNGANVEQLKEVSNLAKRCLEVKGEERPTMKEVAMELEGLRRMVMHPWVNNDESNAEENEHLLGEITLETFSHGGGGDTSSGYDTMRNQITLPVVNDGR
ncbi:putative wall-associated receptor kinase-like 16 [Rosa sericea]